VARSSGPAHHMGVVGVPPSRPPAPAAVALVRHHPGWGPLHVGRRLPGAPRPRRQGTLLRWGAPFPSHAFLPLPSPPVIAWHSGPTSPYTSVLPQCAHVTVFPSLWHLEPPLRDGSWITAGHAASRLLTPRVGVFRREPQCRGVVSKGVVEEKGWSHTETLHASGGPPGRPPAGGGVAPGQEGHQRGLRVVPHRRPHPQRM